MKRPIILPDPEHKRKTAGYLNMRMVRIGNQPPSPLALEGLMRYMRDYTNMYARIEGVAIELSDPELFGAPFIYMAAGHLSGTSSVLFSDIEKEQLGKYLKSGGFLYLEDISLRLEGAQGGAPSGAADVLPFWTQMMAILREILGGDAKIFKLPKSHPVYHSFYDFGDGPPLTDPVRGANDLYGIELGGRLVAVLSNLGISAYWNRPDGERMLQFGVNVVIYALTQQGGIAVAWADPVYGFTEERHPVWEAQMTTIDSTTIPASVAFLRGRREHEADSVWTVVFDRLVVEYPAGDGAYDGLVVLGVPPGKPYTAIIRYGGRERTLTVTPHPGKVTMFWFAMEQIFSRKRLGVQREKREEGYSAWKERYKEKRIVEMLWEEQTKSAKGAERQ